MLGDLGNREHPLRAGIEGAQIQEVGRDGYPVVCIAHSFWTISGDKAMSLCYENNLRARSFTPAKQTDYISPLVGLNAIINMQSIKLKNIFEKHCDRYGPLSYEISVRWLGAYKMQVAKSKRQILKLANELSRSREDFFDLRDESVLRGVRKTLTFNLTNANFVGMSPEADIQFYNSMGTIPTENWLNDLAVFPDFFYADFHKSQEECVGETKQLVANIPTSCGPECDWMKSIIAEPPNIRDEFHSSIGYEKNPWIMAYVGVSAKTKPSKPFLPFGKPIELKATAFAKPFGGRIGPWMYKRWSREAPRSSGTFQDRIDLTVPETPDQGAPINPSYADKAIPNYSRFPGDTLGLSSIKALVAMSFKIKNFESLRIPYDAYRPIPMVNGDNFAQTDPNQATGNPYMVPSDIWGGRLVPWIRNFEMAAVAPDLFDITYYSIDPMYAKNYLPSGVQKSESDFNYDLGALSDAASLLSTGVENQIKAAREFTDSTSGNNYFIVKKTEHLTTGWSPVDAFSYGPNPQLFGKCEYPTKNPFPSSCASGGRVGYSVKIVSKDYLMSGEHQLGGQGAGQGPIINQPP